MHKYIRAMCILTDGASQKLSKHLKLANLLLVWTNPNHVLFKHAYFMLHTYVCISESDPTHIFSCVHVSLRTVAPTVLSAYLDLSYLCLRSLWWVARHMTPVPSDSLSMWSPVENVCPIHACYTAVLAYEMAAPGCKWSVVSLLLHMLILCLGHWYMYFKHVRNTDQHRIVCLHCSLYAWVFTCLSNPSWLSRVICTNPEMRKCSCTNGAICTYVCM